MGGPAKARWAAAALGVAGLLCAVLGAVMIVMVPSLIKQQVLKNVRIDPSSLSFNMWKEIPVPFYLSVYFFDVMNPSEILKGEKPQVQERGPYVYRQRSRGSERRADLLLAYGVPGMGWAEGVPAVGDPQFGSGKAKMKT
ncbi:hypothetical protein H8959_019497 [Pygathrix nigripes]